MSRLLFPEALEQVPLVGGSAVLHFGHRVEDAINDKRNYDIYNNPRPVRTSLVIPTHNNQRYLEEFILQGYNQQHGFVESELVVVDGSSHDDTVKIAKKAGASVINLSNDKFSYPEAVEAGIEAASNELVFVTSSVNSLSNRFQLFASARHFYNPDVGAVFYRSLPGLAASGLEKVSAIRDVFALPTKAHELKIIGRDVSHSASFMLRKSAYEKTSGINSERSMKKAKKEIVRELQAKDAKIIIDPVVAVHYSRRLNR